MAKTITINGVNFTELKGEKVNSLIREYRYAVRKGCYRLWHVYGRFSQAKADAYDECIETMYKVGGSGYYISGYNTCTFSFVYMIKRDDKTYLVKETKCNRFIAEIEIGALR